MINTLNIDFKVPEKLMPFVHSKKRFNLAYGGRWGAKSNFFCMLMLIKGMQEKTKLLFAREVQKSLNDSVFSLCTRLIEEHNLPYSYNKTSIWCHNGTETAFVGISQVTAQSIKSLDGFKYCFVEEAQSLSEDSWKILEPTLRVPDNQFFFAMNRMKIKDPIFHYCTKVNPENSLNVEILYYDNPWMTEEVLRDINALKKNNYQEYLNIYLGQPLEMLDRALIKQTDLQLAFDRNVEEPEGVVELGVDVARFGDDRTVITKRKGNKLLSIDCFRKLSVDKVVEEVMARAEKHELIKVDDTGVGGGVSDYLIRYGYRVARVNFGSSKDMLKDKEKYTNVISEMWFEFKDNLHKYDLIDFGTLREELLCREWKMTNDQRRQIVSKDEYKKLYKYSPDIADSVLLCFYQTDVIDWSLLARD